VGRIDAYQTKIPTSIQRMVFSTLLGEVKEKTEEFKLTIAFMHNLKKIAESSCVSDNEIAIKIEDTYKKGLHKDLKFLALGLRGLIRRDSGIIKFNIRYLSE